MPLIKQLTPHEAQKIAAGQVVERPANVVKELIENSLDAGATHIAIYIHDAGKSLIQVIDNGSGMDEQDAHLCFGHHATSKISSINDLQTLTTFGFRGEALASIAAVSKVTLITKVASATTATKLILDQGTILSQEFIAGNIGTAITITDLLYNIPARKKFLKTNDTEWRQIVLLFQAFCLDYSAIHFQLYSQGNLFFNCPSAATIQQRIAQLWDHTIAQQTVPLQATIDGITIAGSISHHTYTRYDRSCIFFFVNNRWVKNHLLGKALLKGYLNVLPPNKFPLASIALTIDTMQIDVNIHPRKEEVKFLHPGRVEAIISSTVKRALEDNLGAQLQKPVSFFEPTNPTIHPAYISAPIHTPSQSSFSRSLPPISSQEPFALRATYEASTESITVQKIEATTHYQIIGQFHKTYIIIEQEEGLFLVDQHAAHERVLYEQFSKRFKTIATIQLLFPPIIDLTTAQIDLIETQAAFFIDNNIILERISHNQLAIKAVPVHLKEINLEELIHQTVAWMEESHQLDSAQMYKIINEKLHAQMACKAAIKAGDVLTMAQMHQLLNDLEKVENRFTCPHGRPTGWNLPLYEIEKKFKRKM